MNSRRKKRVLVLTSTFPRWLDDSKPSFVYELCKQLTLAYDVFVLAPHYPGARTEEIIEGIHISRFRYYPEKYEKLAGVDGILSTLSHNPSMYVQIPFFIGAELISALKHVKKLKPDLIHAHWIIPQGFIAYLINILTDTPYTITSHGSDIFGLKGLHWIKRICLQKAFRITTVSNELKNRILKDLDSSLEIVVIPMGVNTKEFNPGRKDTYLFEKHNIIGPFLLFVGRIAPEKGLHYLIKALPEIIKLYPETKLLIIGNGNAKRSLEKLAKKLNLDDHIDFLNQMPNRVLPPYYACADAFVCPSLREGAPVSYIESLACGTPIVVGDLPVSRKIVGYHEERGFVVNPRNPKDIAEKIKKVLKEKISFDMGAYEFVKRNYDWEIIGNKYLEVFNN